MKTYHWVVTLVIIVIAYYAGSKGWFAKAKQAVAGA